MRRALVFSLICVFGLTIAGMTATLIGQWDTDIIILPGQTDFNDAINFQVRLTVNYIAGNWTFTSITRLDDGVWEDQDFEVAGLLGPFSIWTAFDLNPNATPVADAAFGDLDVTLQVSIAGMSLEWDFNLDANPDMTITASGTAGAVGASVGLMFGDGDAECDFPWRFADIDLTFGFCCVDLEVDIDFNCTTNGFEDITFVFDGIAIPNLLWLTVGGSVKFDLSAGKTFDLGFDLELDRYMSLCFDIYMDDVETSNGSGFGIAALEVDGIGLACEWGYVLLEGITYWGAADSHPRFLQEYGTQYFEAYRISTAADSCCGPLWFEFSVYFEEDSIGQLFDADLFVGEVQLQVSSQLLLNMGLSVGSTAGFTEWTIGFLVSW